jgi:plastocyanin
MKTRIGAALLALAAGLGGVLAVGSADAAKKAKPTRLSIQADPGGGLTFSRASLKARHGVVIITMKNPGGSGLSHGIGVQGKGVHRDGNVVDPGHASKLQVTLKKGSYTFYCPFDDHRAAGMKGTLTVN